jgi:DNA-binding transcriptional MerR regulator
VERASPHSPRTRAELLASGVQAAELDWLRDIGLVTPDGRGKHETYRGDDLAILRVLGAARRAGLTPDMLPTEILAEYARAIRALVKIELGLFRAGVLPRADRRLPELADQAALLSEQLIVLVRRKLLLPTLEQMVAEARASTTTKKRLKKK